MKKIILTLSAAMLMLGMASCSQKAENKVLANQTDTLSWAMGTSLAQTAQSGFYKFDEDIVREAFESVLRGEKQPLDQKSYAEACDYLNYLASTQSHQIAKQQAQQAQATDEQLFANLEQQNPNIKKTQSGLYYEVLQEGHGPNAKEGLRISFDFKGSYMSDGALIQQTYGTREPVSHVVSRSMFPGLFEGLQLMNAGSKYRFYIPSSLVVDANGTAPNGVVPNRAVVYEVELHEIYKD